MKKSRQERLKAQNKLLAIHEEVERELKKIPGVIGVGVGLKEVSNKTTDELTFRVYVKEKKVAAELEPKDIIPKTIRGIKTDVIVMLEGSLCAMGMNSKKYRPLEGGIQIGSTKSQGTLGCIARLNSGPNAGKAVILSNHHVLYDSGAKKGDKTGQPYYSDCICCACNVIAVIEDGEGSATLDCAIAIINDDITFTNEIREIGWIAGSNTTPLLYGDHVKKYGAKTRFTEGLVIGVNEPLDITKTGETKTGQIQIEPLPPHPKFVDHGDSGSVVVNEDNEVVGLIWWGGGEGNGGANHIAEVMARMKITIERTGTADSIPLGAARERMVEGKYTPDKILTDIEVELKETARGRMILGLINKHQVEVRELINKNREVKVAWQRYEGPAFMVHLINSSRETQYVIPEDVKGVSLQNLLIRMSVVLEKHGGEELVSDINQHSIAIFNYFHGCTNLRALLERTKQADTVKARARQL